MSTNNDLVIELRLVENRMMLLCNHPLSPQYIEYCALGAQRLSIQIALGIVTKQED